jgi:hypothetical protein
VKIPEFETGSTKSLSEEHALEEATNLLKDRLQNEE